MTHHSLKCHPAPFAAAWEGLKLYEVRDTSDRRFEVGDELLLCEYDPDTDTFTGRRVDTLVTYITRPGEYGLPGNICVMGTRVLDRIGEDHRSVWEMLKLAFVKAFARS